jgi:hypothetical protein
MATSEANESAVILTVTDGNQMTAFSSLLPIGHLLSPKSATG